MKKIYGIYIGNDLLRFTKDKVYEFLLIYPNFYEVKSDAGVLTTIKKKDFILLREYNLNKILE